VPGLPAFLNLDKHLISEQLILWPEWQGLVEEVHYLPPQLMVSTGDLRDGGYEL